MHTGLHNVARVLAAAYLITMMFSIGVALGGAEREDKATKRRQRLLLARSLLFNIVVLPLVAFALARLFEARGHTTTALLLLAACPGGRIAPHLTRVAHGDLGLSVEITLWLVKLVAITSPLTASLLLHAGKAELHELQFILQLLALQLVPYLVGKQLRKRRPELATKLDGPLSFAATLCAAAVLALVLLTTHGRGILSLTSERGWLPMIAFTVVAMVLAWLFGAPRTEARRTFVISASMRDLALALMLAQLMFGDYEVLLATFMGWILMAGASYGYAVMVGGGRRRAVTPGGGR
jgi:BASS family bile acid:Na+ symporter